MAFKNGMRPVHPGEVLREDYLKPLDLSVNALSKRLGIPTSRLNDIVLERRGVSPDTAMRLPVISEAMLAPGSTCKPRMICGLQRFRTLKRSSARSSQCGSRHSQQTGRRCTDSLPTVKLQTDASAVLARICSTATGGQLAGLRSRYSGADPRPDVDEDLHYCTRPFSLINHLGERRRMGANSV
jgi:addiction module HigA family antidote